MINFSALQAIYPEYNWEIFKFSGKHNYWSDLKNQREYLDKLGKKLNINYWEDWYQITRVSYTSLSQKIIIIQQKDFLENGCASIMHYYNHSYKKTLMSVYPEHNWHVWGFNRQVYSVLLF